MRNRRGAVTPHRPSAHTPDHGPTDGSHRPQSFRCSMHLYRQGSHSDYRGNRKEVIKMKEFRCRKCGKLLAREAISGALEIRCPRCKTQNRLRTESPCRESQEDRSEQDK